MADEEHTQTSRKRVADKQINKDNPEPDDDSPEQEAGTFKKASEEVMATRRIVKVRRQQQPSAPSNPFSAIRFTPSDSSVQTSIPVSEPPPSDVMTKAVEGTNGSGKDALPTMDKLEGSNEVTGIQKDESGLKYSESKTKSNAASEIQPADAGDKGEDTRVGSVEDKVEVEESKEDDCKTPVIEGDTRDGDEEEKVAINEAGDEEEKVAVNEAGDEEKTSKDGTKKDETDSGAKDGSSDEQKDADNKAQSSSSTPIFSFKNLSSGQNAFTGLAGTGFSGTSFSFGSASKESSNSPLFGLKSDGSSFPSFNIDGTNNGSSSSAALATSAEVQKKFAMPEGPVETGEENEKAVFTADSAMYEYLDGGWKERGKGELKLNIPVSGGERSRLIMRAKGNYRLILNASLYEDMTLKDMDKKGVTFACVNSIGESQSGLTTFALKFKDASIREDFKAVVEANKAKKATKALKTPENSPKASGD